MDLEVAVMSISSHSCKKVVKVKRKYENKLLVMQNVMGCAVGFKELDGETTSELSIIVYVTLKCDELDKRDTIPKSLDGIHTDVQESLTSVDYPISIASVYEVSTRCSMHGAICRLECMEEQKIEAVRRGIRNKVDFALNTPVSLEDIETAAKETGLFLDWLEEQTKADEGKEQKLVSPGVSIGCYLKPINSVFPGAGRFMETLRELKRKLEVTGIKPHLPMDIPDIGEVKTVAEPELGMKVFKVGSTGITEGKIRALDASLFIDYPPHLGGAVKLGEPMFSPSPLFGGRFPKDIISFSSAYVPIKFVTEIYTCPWAGKKPGFPKVPFKRALFEEQIVTDAKSTKGDSGAPLISEDKEFLGMHFAGSDKLSFFNTHQNIMKEIETNIVSE